MSKKVASPAIEFANRHITSDISTFDAASAIGRLTLLLDDCEDAKKNLEPILAERWKPAFFEFVSYYRVGFVTCLEWHAKSRLFDLFMFKPDAINANDVKQGLSDAKILQMLSAQLSVPHLIVSSFNISSMDKYIHVIDRILKVFDGAKDVSDIMTSINESYRTTGEILAELFADRNSLVHEISLQDIGHRNIRDYADFDEVIVTGRKVLELIKAIELNITKYAPSHFPNLLNSHALPISPIERIGTEIDALEAAIADVSSLEDNIGDFDAKQWSSATKHSQSYLKSELSFIDSLEIAGWHYHDPRPNLKRELLDGRLNYLRALLAQVAPIGDTE